MDKHEHDRAIMRGMERAFFASAWADAADEAETGGIDTPTGPGVDIMDVMPEETDRAAIRAAAELALKVVAVYGDTLTMAYHCTMDVVRRNHSLSLRVVNELTPELWGHYAAMQAMGHGVGLYDYGIDRDVLDTPHLEFSQCDLEEDYFLAAVQESPE